MNVGHVAAIFPAQNSAHSHGSLWLLVDAEHIHHDADEMHEQIAGHTGAVFLPATRTREQEWNGRQLWNGTLPGVPVHCLRRKNGRGWLRAVRCFALWLVGSC